MTVVAQEASNQKSTHAPIEVENDRNGADGGGEVDFGHEVDGPPRQQRGAHPAAGRQQQALGHQLADDASATGTEGEAQGQLAASAPTQRAINRFARFRQPTTSTIATSAIRRPRNNPTGAAELRRQHWPAPR